MKQLYHGPERERTMYLLKYAPLNKCTLMFTGELDEIKRDLELLHELNVHKKVRQILVRRMEHTATSQDRLKECCLSHVLINMKTVFHG